MVISPFLPLETGDRVGDLRKLVGLRGNPSHLRAGINDRIPAIGETLCPPMLSLIEKIKALPADRVDEIEDFVDFIAARAKDRLLTRAAAETSVPAFAHIWDNTADDAYDAL